MLGDGPSYGNAACEGRSAAQAQEMKAMDCALGDSDSDAHIGVEGPAMHMQNTVVTVNLTVPAIVVAANPATDPTMNG